MKTILLGIALSIISLPSMGQDVVTVEESSAIKKLSFLIGNWKGSGWFKMQETDSVTITQNTELIKNNQIIQIEGITESTAYNYSAKTIVQIYYDVKKQQYIVTVEGDDGTIVKGEGKLLNENTFKYTTLLNDGLQLRITFSVANSIQTVNGERSDDGTTWDKNFGATLSK